MHGMGSNAWYMQTYRKMTTLKAQMQKDKIESDRADVRIMLTHYEQQLELTKAKVTSLRRQLAELDLKMGEETQTILNS